MKMSLISQPAGLSWGHALQWLCWSSLGALSVTCRQGLKVERAKAAAPWGCCWNTHLRSVSPATSSPGHLTQHPVKSGTQVWVLCSFETHHPFTVSFAPWSVFALYWGSEGEGQENRNSAFGQSCTCKTHVFQKGQQNSNNLRADFSDQSPMPCIND